MQGRERRASERPNHTHRQPYAAIAHMHTIIRLNGAEKNVNICGIHLHRLQRFACGGSWGLTSEIKEGKRCEIEMSEKGAHSIDGRHTYITLLSTSRHPLYCYCVFCFLFPSVRILSRSHSSPFCGGHSSAALLSVAHCDSICVGLVVVIRLLDSHKINMNFGRNFVSYALRYRFAHTHMAAGSLNSE